MSCVHFDKSYGTKETWNHYKTDLTILVILYAVGLLTDRILLRLFIYVDLSICLHSLPDCCALKGLMCYVFMP